MKATKMDASEELWRQIIECTDWSEEGCLFKQLTPQPIEFLREKFRGTGNDRFVAIGLVSHLEMTQRLELFDDLLSLCCSQKFGSAAQEIILQLPRDWVVANIERVAEPIIQYGDYVDFLMLLALYRKLSRDLELKLAKRASQSDDFDTAEVGATCLQRLSSEAR